MTEKPNPGGLERGDHVGVWEIVARIGDGGFGYIYKVQRDGKVYALKIARRRRAELAAEDRGPNEERFHREVSALMALHHPNIVRIRSFDRWPDAEEGYPYLVMDYVEGYSPYDWRMAVKPTLAEICVVFEKLAGAVGHMHRLGICHRDLKDDNVIVRPDGEPVIVDFGLARPERAYEVTQVGGIGTLSHMAPEYVAYFDSGAWGRAPFEWKPSVDIYALGYVLYVTLAGETPITVLDEAGELLGEAQQFERIKNQKPEPLAKHNPAIPASLDAIVLGLLEKDPTKRPQSAEEVAEVLRGARGEAGRAWEVRLTDVENGGEVEPPAELVAEAARPAPREVDLPRVGGGEARAAAGEGGAGAGNPGRGVGQAAPKQPFQEPTRKHPKAFVGEGTEPGATRPAQGKPFAPIPTKDWMAARLPGTAARRRAPLSLFVGGGVVTLTVALILVLGSRNATPAREPQVLLSTRAEPGTPVPGEIAVPESVRPSEPSPAPSGLASMPEPSRPDADGAKGNQVAPVSGKPARKPVRRTAAAKPPPERPPILVSEPISESPILAHTVRLGAEKPAAGSSPRPLGVPLGTHIRARLLTNLDTRTIGSGPVEAEVRVPVVVRGETVLAAHTRAYGTASESNGRFNVRFTQLRLPDDSVVSFEGIAFSREEGKPGLSADRRIEGPPPKTEGLGSKIAKGTGNILLDTVTGGTGQDIARSAGQAALNHEETAPAGSGMVLLLDAGVELDIFVFHPF
jgi:serine/threonine-protein kinase